MLPEHSLHPDNGAVRLDSPETGKPMSDDFEMRMRLQQVAAYRELCRGVRRSGRDNVAFAGLMAFLAYMVWKGGANPFVLAFYGLLIGSELAVGLFKWVFPSAEGHLFDGLVLLLFAAVNLGFQFVAFQRGVPPNPIVILIGLLILGQAFNRFRFYGQLRRMFAERPSAEHLAWFDDLVREINSADPQSDELTLDLQPIWKAKLLGSTAFFVSTSGNDVLVAGADEFEILREKVDRGTGRRRGILRIQDLSYPEIEITDATWANYQRWRTAHPLPDLSSSAAGGPG